MKVEKFFGGQYCAHFPEGKTFFLSFTSTIWLQILVSCHLNLFDKTFNFDALSVALFLKNGLLGLEFVGEMSEFDAITGAITLIKCTVE